MTAPARAWREVARFVIPGPPVGYYAEGRYPNWKRRNAYVAYKSTVQKCAMLAGIKLPLIATRQAPLRIHVWPYFKTGVHSDPENVRKGVVDALFYEPTKGKRGSGDKFTGGSFPPPRYDKDNPRVEVVIEATANGGQEAWKSKK